jgi:hypothetical protein
MSSYFLFISVLLDSLIVVLALLYLLNLILLSEVSRGGKVSLKSKADEALSDDFFVIGNTDEALSDGFF